MLHRIDIHIEVPRVDIVNGHGPKFMKGMSH